MDGFGGSCLPSTSSHSALYKARGDTPANSHKRRSDAAMAARKERRSDGFAQRRRSLGIDITFDSSDTTTAAFNTEEKLKMALMFGDEQKKLAAVKICGQLCVDKDKIAALHDTLSASSFFDIFMQSESFCELESACVIVMAKMSQDPLRVAPLLQEGTIAKLIQCLGSSDGDLVCHVVFLLDIAVSYDAYSRSECDALNIVEVMCQLYTKFDRVDLKRQIISFFVEYFTHPMDAVDVREHSDLLNLLHFVLLNEADEKLIVEAAWVVDVVANFGSEHIDLLRESNLVSAALEHENGAGRAPCESLKLTLAANERYENYSDDVSF